MEPITIAVATLASLFSFLAKDIFALVKGWLKIKKEREYTIELTKTLIRDLEKMKWQKIEVSKSNNDVDINNATFIKLIEIIEKLQTDGVLNIENIDFKNQKVSIELEEEKLPKNNTFLSTTR